MGEGQLPIVSQHPHPERSKDYEFNGKILLWKE